MALRLFSAVALTIAATAAFGQAFGRFGYEQAVRVPGFKIDRSGFVVTDPLSDKIQFSQPTKDWKPQSTSETEQLVQLSDHAGSPSQALFNLLGVGFSLYFPAGIDLRIGSLGAPYLTWKQGSVSSNVATPETQWLVLSFQDHQPAIVIGFPAQPTSLIVTGKAGAWSIKSADDFKGWVRFGLPQGLQAPLANTASSLGRLANNAALHVRLWTSMPPRLIKTSTASDLHSVTATWQFDGPGAVVPPAAQLAGLAGYHVTIDSKTVRLPGWTDAGPIDVVPGNALTIRFPVRRVPTGRCLALGSSSNEGLGTASPQDIPSVAQLALESLVAGRDTLTEKACEQTTSEYISQANYFSEPWTRQQLPFDRAGKGIDLAAAHAFLMQAVTSTSKATSESNSLLTSVCWRQDWLTWRVWTDDVNVAQRAGALAALAGALCPEPERRLAAAMFQAGLSGMRGLNIWKVREGLIKQAPKLIEPLYGVRKGLFGLAGVEAEGEAFAHSLLSPLRVFSDGPVVLVKEGPEYVLQTDTVDAKRTVLMLASAYPIQVSSKTNIASISVAAALGFTEIHFKPETIGLCEFKLKLPEFGLIPPDQAEPPIYSEIAK